MSVSSIFSAGGSENRSALPAQAELRSLLERCRPSTVLRSLPGDLPSSNLPPNILIFRTEALMELDRFQEAYNLLEAVIPRLESDALAEAGRLWVQALLHKGDLDEAILASESACRAAQREDYRAAIMAWGAVGFSYKRCWQLAEARLREAIEISPNNPYVLAAQARLRLEADQRIEARRIYERLAAFESVWAKVHAGWGRSHVAYLLGEFDRARFLAEESLQHSQEILSPLFVLGQVALAEANITKLEAVALELERRSPQAESLGFFKAELSKLRARTLTGAGKGKPRANKRLLSFPTLVQRRDHCGPSTVELVLRYWKGGLDITTEQIAEKVKFPKSGTPIYRMREFFHLVGFDTVRTLAPVGKLKKLIDAGYPVIVQEEFSNSSHVAVVIGYNNDEGSIELQDPMTHIITSTAWEELNRLRKLYLDSALVAFPSRKEHNHILAGLDLFDHPALIWTDQAVLEMDEGRPETAADLAQRAVKKLPILALAWVMLLHARMEIWQNLSRMEGDSSREQDENGAMVAEAREQFYDALAQARRFHAGAEFIFQFEGNGALMDQDVAHALRAFQRASDLDPADARNYASLAECFYTLRDLNKALEAAMKALRYDPALPSANVWAARCMTILSRSHADHYARVALELIPDWWMAHQAAAEVAVQAEDLALAHRENDAALFLSPSQPEALVMRGALMAMEGETIAAVALVKSVLQADRRLSSMVACQANQALCRIYYGAASFDLALAQVNRLLENAPQDSWALQFRADAYSQALIQAGEEADEQAYLRMHEYYMRALTAHAGASWLAHDYLLAVEALAGPLTCLEVIEKLRQAYPEVSSLFYLHGTYLSRTGRLQEAADLMFQALIRPEGISDQEQLYHAAEVILQGYGVQGGERKLLDAPVPEGGASIAERERALGLAMAAWRGPEEQALAARRKAAELLRQALARDAEDALATLRLGDVVQAEEDREMLYRRALMLAPRWAVARANLADYLTQHNRGREALEFTAGHESEAFDLLLAHGRALLNVGHYEDAVSIFAQAIEQSEQSDASVYFDRWIAELKSGWIESAMKTVRRAIEIFPADPRWYLHLASTLRAAGELAEAQRVIEKGFEQGLSQEEVLKAEYEIAMMQQDYASALSLLEELLDNEEEQVQEGRLAWAEGARLRVLVELNQLDKIYQFLEQENLDAEGWGQAAWMVMMTDDHELTLELAERALALDPVNYGGLYARSQALADLGWEHDAIVALYRLRDAYPIEHNAYEKLALRAAVEENLDQAFELAERAVVLGPFCPLAWATRGYVSFLRGQAAEAAADMQTAWNRADARRRQKTNHFWWILAALQGEARLAEEYKRAALAEAKTDLEQRILSQIEARLEEAPAANSFPS